MEFQISTQEWLKEYEMVEKKLLGDLLTYPQTIENCFEIINETDFSNKEYGKLFKEICERYLKNEEISIITLIDKFKASFLTELMLDGSLFSDTKKLAQRIKKNSISRKLFNIFEEKEKTIKGKKEKIENTIMEVSKELTDASSKLQWTSKNESKELIEELNKEREKLKNKKLVGYPTWDSLDQLVNGLIIPNIWIIGGYSGTGKTYFTLQLIERVMRNDAKVVLFSTELSKMRNILRLIGCHTGIPEMKILKNDLSLDEDITVKEAERNIETKNLFIYDNVFTTAEIQMKLYNHIKKNGTEIAVIDYIQQLDTRDDSYEQMRLVSSNLQKMSQSLNCSIIGVSQISNEGQRSKNFFRMNFKGAGEIGAIADVAIELKRSESDFNTLGVIVKKVRHGIPGTLKFNFFSDKNRMEKNYISEQI